MKAIACAIAMVAVAAAGPAKTGHYIRADRSAKASAERRQEGSSTFTVGTASAARGQRANGAIRVPAGVDAGYEIPVTVIHGARSGPVLAVVAGSHGSEYASIMAVEELMTAAPARAIDPAKLAGTLILVPLVNVASFERITPHLNPVDDKNMNRFYPGTSTGTQTERASYAITKEVVEKCDHLIDLHGGDLDENLRPYSYWTVTGNQKQDDASRAMVLAFGLEHIIISSDRPKDPGASRFLENTASTRGKPSFTAEAGRSGPVDPADVAVLVDGVKGVMTHLHMTDGKPRTVAKPIWIERIASIAAEHDGMFHAQVARDAHVAKGAPIGIVTDYWNKPLATIAAPEAGIVMFVRALPSLRKGDTIVNIGVVRQGK